MVASRTGTSPAGPDTATQSSTGLEQGLEVWADLLRQESGDGKVLGEHTTVARWAAAVSRWLVDATLLADAANLHQALEIMRAAAVRLRPGGPTAQLEMALLTLAEVARAGLDRARQSHLADTLDPNSWAARMLVLVCARPHITSADIVSELRTHEAQISRSGKSLVERGLLVKNRHGRSKGWHATPRGAAIAQRLADRAPY
ncbi:MarR family transcriptional regulator [Actinosynnema sp. ALI-1.44]|uniref:MarR family transcriptional regulator n=1 Tax=Actinosynnema sp. ALI-1.44 TaxID=1933779 RepID=UPI00097BD069|nr:MarR family transcriptional regulator [Actinosynnema sp. ALI-1.44]ONI75129.1 MarR family transcriptional regulator [Actinosynnema sp. ALI-1.44]